MQTHLHLLPIELYATSVMVLVYWHDPSEDANVRWSYIPLNDLRWKLMKQGCRSFRGFSLCYALQDSGIKVVRNAGSAGPWRRVERMRRYWIIVDEKALY